MSAPREASADLSEGAAALAGAVQDSCKLGVRVSVQGFRVEDLRSGFQDPPLTL